MSTVPPHTAIGMPLSLRRPKRQPDPLLTADQSRSVSTPTLLSRLRNSTFSRSKASLLSSFAYETVRSRTPPTPYSPSTILPPCQPAFREQPMLEPEPKKDKWEERGFNLTREQRECLAGAVCLGVWDPITEEDEMPKLNRSPSNDSTIVLHEILETSEDDVVSSSAPSLHTSFHHLSRYSPPRPVPDLAKLEDIFTPPSPSAVFTPYRKVTLRSRVRQAKARSAFGSPILVPLRPEYPEHTPTRICKDSPEWSANSLG